MFRYLLLILGMVFISFPATSFADSSTATTEPAADEVSVEDDEDEDPDHYMNLSLASQLYVNNPLGNPTLQLNTDYSKGGAWGGRCVAITSKTWSEVLCGPTLTLLEGSLSIGVLGGLEQWDNTDWPLRGGAFTYAALGLVDLYTMVEYGISGFWHHAILRAGHTGTESRLGAHIGILSERFMGEGLYLDFEYSRFRFFMSGVYGFEDHRAANKGFSREFLRAMFGLNVVLFETE